ncbi:UNVERIFIED_CONTAM: hypothetical protein FKN15_049530 [Acipenser sinensis]
MFTLPEEYWGENRPGLTFTLPEEYWGENRPGLTFTLPEEYWGSTLLIIPIKDGEEIRQSDPGHFCYSNELVPGWKETWTRIQIQVRSSQKFKVTVVEDEEKLKELEQFNFWTLFQYFIKERSNETTISVNLFSSKTCFKVEPSDKTTSYTISVYMRSLLYSAAVHRKIQVRSSQKFKVTVVEDEEKLKELEQFNFWTLFQYFIKERSNETTISVNLFSSKTCFKVEPSDKTTSYTISLTRNSNSDFNILGFVQSLIYLYLFMYVCMYVFICCCRSPAFFYSAGISTGMIASLIILVFIVARFLPKKSPFYVLLVGGWSFSLYLIQLMFRNLQHLIKQHWQYVTGYVMLVGFLSFAVCYRHGPLVEERSINLLSWVLQLLGLLLLYAGIQVQQVAVALIIAAVCAKNLEYPVQLVLAVHG